jgi:hypothetical protein
LLADDLGLCSVTPSTKKARDIAGFFGFHYWIQTLFPKIARIVMSSAALDTMRYFISLTSSLSELHQFITFSSRSASLAVHPLGK